MPASTPRTHAPRPSSLTRARATQRFFDGVQFAKSQAYLQANEAGKLFKRFGHPAPGRAAPAKDRHAPPPS